MDLGWPSPITSWAAWQKARLQWTRSWLRRRGVNGVRWSAGLVEWCATEASREDTWVGAWLVFWMSEARPCIWFWLWREANGGRWGSARRWMVCRRVERHVPVSFGRLQFVQVGFRHTIQQRIAVVKSGANDSRCDIHPIIECDELPNARSARMWWKEVLQTLSTWRSKDIVLFKVIPRLWTLSDTGMIVSPRWEILIAFGFYEDAQWAHLVAWALDAASCGVHLEGKVR